MPVLDNPRHERFAQYLAEAKTAAEAYVLVGFKPNRGNPSKLAHRPSVAARVKELTSHYAELAAKTAITTESLVQDSEKVFQRAMETNQLSAANTAIKGKGILSGKWIERAEVGGPGEYDALTDDELERQIMERLARLGLMDVLTLHIPHMDNAADVDNAG
jgi:hypothetical protein